MLRMAFEETPAWVAVATVGAALIGLFILQNRRPLKSIWKWLFCISFSLVFLLYAGIIAYGYFYFEKAPRTAQWEYRWTDVLKQGDWGGHDLDCSATDGAPDKPQGSICDENHAGRYAVCWSEPPRSLWPDDAPNAKKCNDLIKSYQPLCVYKSAEFTDRNPDPNSQSYNPGFLFRCLKSEGTRK